MANKKDLSHHLHHHSQSLFGNKPIAVVIRPLNGRSSGNSREFRYRVLSPRLRDIHTRNCAVVVPDAARCRLNYVTSSSATRAMLLTLTSPEIILTGGFLSDHQMHSSRNEPVCITGRKSSPRAKPGVDLSTGVPLVDLATICKLTTGFGIRATWSHHSRRSSQRKNQ